MKDKDSKPIIKSARKTARMAIQLRIVSELKLIAKQFGQDSEELNHEMEKGAKKLAKKIAEQLKITPQTVTGTTTENKATKPVEQSKPAISAKKSPPPVKAVNGTVKKVAAKTVSAKPAKKEKPG